MTPNFLHVRSTFEHALPILNKWVDAELDADALELEEEDNGWITLSIDLDYQETDEWLRLATDLDFFYESYSASLRMGEIVFCQNGGLVRHLLLNEANPDDNVDTGRLPSEETSPLTSWADIWGYVDDRNWTKDT